jgi:hypothetical protein
MMLRLPDEILLNITNRFDSCPIDLRYLALTHSRFRSVVHETLICSGVVPVQSIPQYLGLLWPHQQWIARIKRVHLVDTDRKFEHPSTYERAISLEFIRAILPSAANSCEFNFQDPNDHEIWILALLVTLSAAKELTITSSKPEPDPGFRIFFKGYKPPSTKKSLTDIVSARLEVLSVTECTYTAQQFKKFFQSPHFRQLKVLNITGGCIGPFTELHLGFTDWYRHRIDRILSGLNALNIYCDEFTCPWFFLNRLYRDSFYPAWKCFLYPPKIRLFLNEPHPRLAQEIVDTLQWKLHHPLPQETWEQHKLPLEIFFRKGKKCLRVDSNPEHYKLGNVYAFVAMRREINGAATNFLALLTRP